jgi:GDP-4-dehydro-6-deoxy-D-mannose reductase
MKVLVTGARGFVGRWLTADLRAAGHEPIEAPHKSVLDIADGGAVVDFVRRSDMEAVVHLAGVSFSPDARRDPERAFQVNVGGTLALLEGIRATRPAGSVPVVVVGSGEVYAPPATTDLPLSEDSALGPATIYGLSKLAAEGIAVEAATERGALMVATRSFNHIGPGQRVEFAIPALAMRVLEAARTNARSIVAGNVSVRRDFTDVRDVVRAYRLLLEALAESRLPTGSIFNVASGRAVAIGDVIAVLSRLAEIDVSVETDPSLVRPDEPFEIRGDATKIGNAIGWRPEIALDTTLADVLADMRTRGMVSAAPA